MMESLCKIKTDQLKVFLLEQRKREERLSRYAITHITIQIHHSFKLFVCARHTVRPPFFDIILTSQNVLVEARTPPPLFHQNADTFSCVRISFQHFTTH